MAEVLLEFANGITDPEGGRYTARVCGRQREDGRWEGWIEFVPPENGSVLATARETTQPSHADLIYWAGGLTAVYLEGALQRARDAALQHEKTGGPLASSVP